MNELVPVRWTRFMDMHSGGRTKVVIDGQEFERIYIEVAEVEAKIVFYNRFGHSPERVTCTCCGEDYSTDDGESLQQLSAYDRGCNFNNDRLEYAEERDRSMDKYVLEAIGRMMAVSSVPKRVGDLYRMARDESSPAEARLAMDRLQAITLYPNMWSPAKFVPYEEFLKTGELGNRFGTRGHAMLIRAAEIKPEERRGTLPTQGYVWM